MPVPQLLFVSGKGGTGKTTMAAALAIAAAQRGMSVLLVDPTGESRFPTLSATREFEITPRPMTRNLHGVRIEPRKLVEAYFTRLLRLPLLSRPLLASSTFRAVTAAAPGVAEFLLLEKLREWVGNGASVRRSAYDLVIVDGPATGHVLRLLRAPRQITAMVPGGPIAGSARRLQAMLADRQKTQVVLVAVPDEMAVTETIEGRAAIANGLQFGVSRPVLNRMFPRRFTRSECVMIAERSRSPCTDPVLAAARLQIRARHDTEQHLRRLRRAFGVLPIAIRQVCGKQVARGDLEHIGATLGRALLETR